MISPPATAPGRKVAQAAAVIRRPPVWPVGPIVSIAESPHGEKVPVAPISSAAAGEGELQGATQHGTFVS